MNHEDVLSFVEKRRICSLDTEISANKGQREMKESEINLITRQSESGLADGRFGKENSKKFSACWRIFSDAKTIGLLKTAI